MSTMEMNPIIQPTTKRPKNTKFKQQKLPAWQPVMSAGSVLPILFAVGIAFIPLGIAFLITANNVQEFVLDYTTNCEPNCGETMKDRSLNTCRCSLNFTLKEDFRANVYMYYSLSNYYQNHRRYVKSYEPKQLEGSIHTYDAVKYQQNCADPYLGVNGSVFAPCGVIANSMFNDTLSITYNGNDSVSPTLVGLNNTGIAWKSDISTKYKNPAAGFNNTIKPPSWINPVNKLDEANPMNNGYQNEDLIVWMRTAALPTFRKLYRRIYHAPGGPFQDGLPAGNYTLTVDYNYRVLDFSGRKRMILTTTSFLGGKNPFLGIAYLVVGTTCILAGFMFLVIHLKVGKSNSSLGNDINNRTLY